MTAWLISPPADLGWKEASHASSSINGTLSGSALTDALGSWASTVAAIVTLDDPTETATESVGYDLTVNGVSQPGS